MDINAAILPAMKSGHCALKNHDRAARKGG